MDSRAYERIPRIGNGEIRLRNREYFGENYEKVCKILENFFGGHSQTTMNDSVAGNTGFKTTDQQPSREISHSFYDESLSFREMLGLSPNANSALGKQNLFDLLKAKQRAEMDLDRPDR